jgi:hypothetical protein
VNKRSKNGFFNPWQRLSIPLTFTCLRTYTGNPSLCLFEFQLGRFLRNLFTEDNIIKLPKMKLRHFSLSLVGLTLSFAAMAQNLQNCCNNEACHQLAIKWAEAMRKVVGKVGICSQDPDSATAINNRILFGLSKKDYDDFWTTATATAQFINDSVKNLSILCFKSALQDDDERSNVLHWLKFVENSINKPTFASGEFCFGWKKRLEAAYGSSAFLNKANMASLGTLRAYIVYTFKNAVARNDSLAKCGGRVRLMAGPAYFLRNTISYMTLSSKLAFRLGHDIYLDPEHSQMDVGNYNIYAEYNSNFARFNYAGIGFEVELGPIALNCVINDNIENGKPGFLIGVALFNTGFKKTNK